MIVIVRIRGGKRLGRVYYWRRDGEEIGRAGDLSASTERRTEAPRAVRLCLVIFYIELLFGKYKV